MTEVDDWLEECLPKHQRLTDSVVTIIRSLLVEREIDFLSVTGRTKDRSNIIEKIKRKRYNSPSSDLTDISGIRIIVFIESDLEKVANIIRDSFHVDVKNSSNKIDRLSSDQVGYRSVHFVCELGQVRNQLPEFKGLSGLKFEFQLRTVLQHAWAELSHDRQYKFKTELPKDIERKIYLYAGLLELADKGFSEISRDIDIYAKDIASQYSAGILDAEINSITLTEFIEQWSSKNNIAIDQIKSHNTFKELISEINSFGIDNISGLGQLIPPQYSKIFNELDLDTNIFGVIRDWMIIKDVDKLKKEVGVTWHIADEEEYGDYLKLYKKLSSPDNFQKIVKYINEELGFENA